MINDLIVANVLHRPVRTLVSIIAVGIEVCLIIIVVGLTSGLIQDTGKRIEGIGADIMLQPPSSSIFLAFSGAPMPIKVRDKLLTLPHVKAVAPVLLQFNASGGLDIIYGIDLASFNAVSGGFVFHGGTEFQGPDDILVDDWYARAKKLQVGQPLRLLEHEFRVAGIVEHGKGARLFVPLETLQAMAGSRDKASIFFVKCTRPDYTPSVMAEIAKLFPKHQIRPLKDYLSLMTSSHLPGLDTFVDSMILLAAVIGFLVIFLSMYTTILERTRDIGILKSLGASNGYIIGVILRESSFVCVVGIGVGVGFSYLARKLMIATFPTLTILITAEWILKAAALALAGSLLGASYPALAAARQDTIEALAHH